MNISSFVIFRELRRQGRAFRNKKLLKKRSAAQVINLTPEKGQVFRECFRVLKPGGRLCISDVVTRGERPITVAGDLEGGAYTEEEGICACVTGAVSAADLEELLEDALFQDVSIAINEHSTTFIKDWLPGSGSEKVVASAIIEAVKSKHAAGKCC